MSFRNRPVLDRKHRPRWQDELRTQQLIVAGFALAIAAAIGIFAATTWFNYYEGHLRPAAAVGDVTFTIDDLQERVDTIGAELQASYADLTDQLGGPRDPIIQQAQGAIQQASSQLTPTASNSLVRSRVLAGKAASYGISVSDAQVNAEANRRRTLTERLRLSLIVVLALPSDAKPGDKPTDADWAKAKTDIDAIAAQLRDGADFATVAKEKSADSTAAGGGALGWVPAEDQTYGSYFTEAHAGTVGDLVGPTKDETGYHLLRLDDRVAQRPNTVLKDLLDSAGVSDGSYRAYIRGELLKTAFSDYFKNVVMARYQPQRMVSQIYIAAQQGTPVPQQRLRHFLAQPVPGQQDQSTATDAQWAAALARAEAFRVEASKPDADWFTLAATSDDTSSGIRGGDLGWYDAASSSFVQAFKNAVATLNVGEISKPVKTEFGYHVIEITAARTSVSDQVEKLQSTLRATPDEFATLAREQSEDAATAKLGGDLGWVIRYQLDTALSDAIFGLTTAGQISDAVEAGGGFYIFKLTDTSPQRWVPVQTLEQVQQTGVTRWLQEIQDGANTWIDPQYGSAPATG